VETEQLPEFEKFVKSFSLSSKAEEIEYILELENGVTKHYESLVPTQISPQLFWARYILYLFTMMYIFLHNAVILICSFSFIL
jgi:hypothetical protein